MTRMTLTEIPRTYKINGQHAEQTARFALTGKIEKADNRPFTMGGDCGNIQIKSARATICKGTDIKAHLDRDPAEFYGYVTEDFKTMVIMTKTEYWDFCREFGATDRESKKNGGAVKMRFGKETKKMKEWLGV